MAIVPTMVLVGGDKSVGGYGGRNVIGGDRGDGMERDAQEVNKYRSGWSIRCGDDRHRGRHLKPWVGDSCQR